MADLLSPRLPSVNRGFIFRISSIAGLGGVWQAVVLGFRAVAPDDVRGDGVPREVTNPVEKQFVTDVRRRVDDRYLRRGK